MNIKPNRAQTDRPVAYVVPQVQRPRSYGWVIAIAVCMTTAGWWWWDRHGRFSANAMVVVNEIAIAAPCTGLIESMRVAESVVYAGGTVAFSVVNREARDDMASLVLELKLLESKVNERVAMHTSRRSEYLYARDVRLAVLRADLGKARLDLSQINQKAAHFTAALTAYRNEYERLLRARGKDAAAQQEVEDALAQWRGAEGELAALAQGEVDTLARIDSLEQAYHRPIPRGADLERVTDPIRRQSDLVRGRIEQLNGQLANQTVLLPAPGRIRRIIHRPGEYVRMGDPVLVVQEPGSVRVMAYIRQHQLGDIEEGDGVRIVSAYAPTVHGRVSRVMPSLQAAPRAISVRLPEGTPLLPVEITLDRAGRRMLIPGSTVRVYADGWAKRASDPRAVAKGE